MNFFSLMLECLYYAQAAMGTIILSEWTVTWGARKVMIHTYLAVTTHSILGFTIHLMQNKTHLHTHKLHS